MQSTDWANVEAIGGEAQINMFWFASWGFVYNLISWCAQLDTDRWEKCTTLKFTVTNRHFKIVNKATAILKLKRNQRCRAYTVHNQELLYYAQGNYGPMYLSKRHLSYEFIFLHLIFIINTNNSFAHDPACCCQILEKKLKWQDCSKNTSSSCVFVNWILLYTVDIKLDHCADVKLFLHECSA